MRIPSIPVIVTSGRRTKQSKWNDTIPLFETRTTRLRDVQSPAITSTVGGLIGGLGLGSHLGHRARLAKSWDMYDLQKTLDRLGMHDYASKVQAGKGTVISRALRRGQLRGGIAGGLAGLLGGYGLGYLPVSHTVGLAKQSNEVPEAAAGEPIQQSLLRRLARTLIPVVTGMQGASLGSAAGSGLGLGIGGLFPRGALRGGIAGGLAGGLGGGLLGYLPVKRMLNSDE